MTNQNLTHYSDEDLMTRAAQAEKLASEYLAWAEHYENEAEEARLAAEAESTYARTLLDELETRGGVPA